MQFKIRASAAGEIMGVKGLGKTGQGFVEKWYKEQLYNRTKSFTSKYTEKGNVVEDSAIQLVADHFGLGLLMKNEQHYSNEFFKGTPDVVTSDLIIDVKSSWDCFTFPLFADEIPNKDYYYQMQVYMALTGLSKSKLIYCLMDTPDDIIEKEAYYYCENNGVDYDMDFLEQFKKQYIYSHLPIHLRIKSFDIMRDDAVIEQIKQRVKECNEYLNQIKINN